MTRLFLAVSVALLLGACEGNMNSRYTAAPPKPDTGNVRVTISGDAYVGVVAHR